MISSGPAALVSPIFGSLASSIAGAFLSGVTTWVIDGAATLVRGVAVALLSTTAVPFNVGFETVFSEIRLVAFPFVGIFMALAIVRALIRQDLADLGRMVFLRLPLALLGSGVALDLTALLLKATDNMSGALLSSAGSSVSGFATGLSAALVLGGGSPPGGSVAFLLAAICGVVAFFLWIELVIRSSAIAIAALFIPLALAGAVWSGTSSWGKRLGEVLAALILSKLVIAAVFALAITEIGGPSGVTGMIQGAALLVLATLAPWTLVRLVPAVEGGLVSGLEGIGARAKSAAIGSAGAIVDYATDGGEPGLVPAASELASNVGKPADSPELRALVAEFETTLLPTPGRTAASSSQSPLQFGNLTEAFRSGDVAP